MAVATGQDFETFAGDTANPTFTVYKADGVTTENLASVNEIEWNAARGASPGMAPVVAASLTQGNIILLASGLTGRFQVRLTSADTSPLSGFYIHEAVITDDQANITTVSLGRMQVGRQPVWTYSGDPNTSPRDGVRFYIQDTDIDNQLFTDPEIDALLIQWPDPVTAAAKACTTLAIKYAGLVDKAVGDLKLSYSQRSKAYQALAADLEAQGTFLGGLTIFSGGTTIPGIVQANEDTNRQRPSFQRGQNDRFPPPGEGSIYNSGQGGRNGNWGNNGGGD